MRGKVVLPVLLLFISSLSFFESVYSAEECYTCYFMEADGISESDLGEVGSFKPDKSCRSGKKPDSDLTASCYEPWVRHREEEAGGNSSSFLPEDFHFSCVKAYFHGEVILGDVVKATARTCFPWPKNSHPSEDCSVKTLDELINGTPPEVREYLELLTEYVDRSASGTFCTCDGNNCNSAPPTFQTHYRMMEMIMRYLFILWGSYFVINCM